MLKMLSMKTLNIKLFLVIGICCCFFQPKKRQNEIKIEIKSCVYIVVEFSFVKITPNFAGAAYLHISRIYARVSNVSLF